MGGDYDPVASNGAPPAVAVPTNGSLGGKLPSGNQSGGHSLLGNCESVLSEACFLLREVERGAESVLALVARKIVLPEFPLQDEAAAVAKLMQKYADIPMALADACLVRMTELLHRDTAVLTLDGDFRIYRRNRRQVIPLIAPEGLGGSLA
jgi:hypothetical protein